LLGGGEPKVGVDGEGVNSLFELDIDIETCPPSRRDSFSQKGTATAVRRVISITSPQTQPTHTYTGNLGAVARAGQNIDLEK
jgi:hypothetical protein